MLNNKKKLLSKIKFRCHSLGSIVGGMYSKYEKDLKHLKLLNTMEFGIQLTSLQCKAFKKIKEKSFNNLAKTEQALLDTYHKKLQEKKELEDKINNFNYEFSEGAISKLNEIYYEEVFGIKPLVTTKSITRGIDQEDDSIDILSKVLNIEISKNTQRFTNEYITGEPDLIYKNSIIDVKTCESYESFDAKTEKSAFFYFWQLYGYQILTNKYVKYIAYLLPSYKENVIKKIILYHFNKIVSFEHANYYYDAFSQFSLQKVIQDEVEIRTDKKIQIVNLYNIYNQEMKNHNYDRIPFSYRVKLYEVKDLRNIDYRIVYKILDKARAYLVSKLMSNQPLNISNLSF